MISQFLNTLIDLLHRRHPELYMSDLAKVLMDKLYDDLDERNSKILKQKKCKHDFISDDSFCECTNCGIMKYETER